MIHTPSRPFRFLFMIICFILLVLSGSTYFYIRDVDRTMKAEIYETLNEVSIQNATVIYKQINGDLHTLQILASYLGQEVPLNKQQILARLSKVTVESGFKRLGIIMPSGEAMTTDGAKLDLSDREYFHQALAGNPAVSPTLTDKTNNNGKINVYAVPIKYNNQVLAVLYAIHSIEQFRNALNVSTFDGNGYSYIVEGDGTLVVGSNHQDSLHHIDNFFQTMEAATITDQKDINKMKDNMAHSQRGIISYTYHGVPKYLSYTPIGINDWYVFSVVPAKVLDVQANRLTLRTMLICLVIILVFLLLLIYVSYLQKRSKRVLETLAYIDPLTGMYNWNKLDAEYRDSWSLRRGQKYALIAFDINNFKLINELYGVAQGDTVLIHIADTIRKVLTPGEIAARLSNDNFSMILRYESDEQLLERLKKFDQLLHDAPDQLDQSMFHSFSLSYGIYRIGAMPDDSILNKVNDKANLARKTIKVNSEHNYAFYNDIIHDTLIFEQTVENFMQSSLDNGDFEVYLQPKYNLQNGRRAGAEALIRWKHPTEGFLMPDQFIPQFERNGFIIQLDSFVLRNVCAKQKEWLLHGENVLPIAVNLSRVHFRKPDLAEHLAAVVSEYEIPFHLIELEVTESAVLNQTLHLPKVIHALHQYGFLISMDDFGSGFSSLNMLKSVEIDVLKLDKEFLRNSNANERGRIILRDVILMAKDLHITVVAEGVETKEQAEFLRGLGCDMAQGFYYAKPMPISVYEKNKS